MSGLDWLVLTIYICIIIGLSFNIGRAHRNQQDYYLGGKRLKGWQIGSSLVANQVSAISLVGAPAFIAIKHNGGLKWLQYELAIPLAMIFIMIFFVPFYLRNRGFSVYEFLEIRFGVKSRLCLGFVFLVSRSLATGVALLATSYVTSVCIGLNLTTTILIIGFISMIYVSMGGIKADIYSDIIQLVILWLASFVTIFVLLTLMKGNISFDMVDISRFKVFDFHSSGLGDGSTFSFFPMLIGGLFLYISYYGCDQSQAQRIIGAADRGQAQRSLFINGILRFPLVLTYSAIGVLILPFLISHPEFHQKISSFSPDYLMPIFFQTYLPSGILGMVIAGIFAASMSSLDSAINSISAITWEDFLVRRYPGLNRLRDQDKVVWSRFITIFWGIFITLTSLVMANSSETVIELVNKIGSAFYGPIAGIFILAITTRDVKESSALTGFFMGVGLNISLWLFFPNQVSWMWWNATGLFTTIIVAVIISLPHIGWNLRQFKQRYPFIPRKFILILSGYFLLIFTISMIMERILYR